MHIYDLNEAAVLRLFDEVIEGIKKSAEDNGIEDVRHFLRVIVDELDSLDEDDAFGTEGWRHAFGVDY